MILHAIRLKRAADDADLTDLTISTRNGDARWIECAEHPDGNCLDLPLRPEPTVAESALIRRRLVTTDAADEARLGDLLTAAADSAAPTWAQLMIRAELTRYDESLA